MNIVWLILYGALFNYSSIFTFDVIVRKRYNYIIFHFSNRFYCRFNSKIEWYNFFMRVMSKRSKSAILIINFAFLLTLYRPMMEISPNTKDHNGKWRGQWNFDLTLWNPTPYVNLFAFLDFSRLDESCIVFSFVFELKMNILAMFF